MTDALEDGGLEMVPTSPVHPGRRWRVWRSPDDQPAWARPALLVIAALASFTYAWGIGGVTLEPFYGAAARSMSESWHNFIFGAFDPFGTVSVDKLPGALWLQALSLRVFGFHLWAIALPQVIEGTLTVLVLYRLVRRVAGPLAGLAAAAVLAITPVTALLNRGNISDSLLILLSVLAADAALRAIETGRIRSLAWAGVWVGLAFQAKMTQAWFVLPALYLAYLVAAPAASFLRRCGHVLLSVVVVAVVSLSWMSAISLVPTHDRPYADGSCNDSVFSQVFVYNGIDRISGHELDAPGCSPPSTYALTATFEGAAAGLGTFIIPPSWDRLLHGPLGRDDAWVLVPTLVSAIGLLLMTRRRPRTDPERAAAVLWLVWLVVIGGFFSGGQYLNSYYVAALMPAMAALCGLGAATAWRTRDRVATRATVAATVVAGAAYSAFLMPGNAGLEDLAIGSIAGSGAVSVAILLASLRRAHRTVWTLTVGLGLSAVSLLLGSAWATGSVVASGLGPFDTPYQPASVTYLSQTLPAIHRETWPKLSAQVAEDYPAREAVDTFESSALAADDILATGHEFLPLGGFSGRVPSPSLHQLMVLIGQSRVPRALAQVDPLTNNPDMRWIVRNCLKQTYGSDATIHDLGVTFQRYQCAPYDIVPRR